MHCSPLPCLAVHPPCPIDSRNGVSQQRESSFASMAALPKTLSLHAFIPALEAFQGRSRRECGLGLQSRGRRLSIAGVWEAGNKNWLPQNVDLPEVRSEDEKKPYVGPPRRLIKKGFKKPPLEDWHAPPGNGLVVPELVPVAHAVFEARETLLQLVAALMRVVPVKVCRFCYHSHIGPIGHDIATCMGQGSSERYGRHIWEDGRLEDVVSNLEAYHSEDRLKLIKHRNKYGLKRHPAVVELCIQAGVDLPGYPVIRRTRPVYGSGRMKIEIDDIYSEFLINSDLSEKEDFDMVYSAQAPHVSMSSLSKKEGNSFGLGLDRDGRINSNCKSESMPEDSMPELTLQSFEETKQVAEMALRLWEVMRDGAQSLMTRYTVRACGYCPEVHIGPRGHLVRSCAAFKHQWRNGQHFWQVAGLDDLIPPKFVWHVPDLKNPLLLNDLRSFYGQVPAVVELCVQAGANIPDKYRPMMRLDVVAPSYYEAEIAT